MQEPKKCRQLADLLGRAVSAEARDESGWYDLHYAAALDLPGAVAALVEAGTPVDAPLPDDPGRIFCCRRQQGNTGKMPGLQDVDVG